MKLDLKYVKNILKHLRDAPAHEVSTETLINSIDQADTKIRKNDYFAHHIIQMGDAGLIASNKEVLPNNKYGLSLRSTIDGNSEWIPSGRIYITIEGESVLKYLEEPRIWSEFKKMAKNIGFSNILEFLNFLKSII